MSEQLHLAPPPIWQSLEEVESSAKACQQCGLCQTRTNVVFAAGSPQAKLMVIAEAPGRNEDEAGVPFVGRAGKLLDSSIKSIGYKREDVWIGNIIKHRPPDNREPLPDEISACAPFLELQLKTIAPVMVVTLGRYSMNYFYPGGKISKDRGNLIKIRNFFIYPV